MGPTCVAFGVLGTVYLCGFFFQGNFETLQKPHFRHFSPRTLPRVKWPGLMPEREHCCSPTIHLDTVACGLKSRAAALKGRGSTPANSSARLD